jgi:O-antigen/teichoic acid export membrane protein
MLSVLVQIISLLVSFILNLIVPKYIPELQYAHWQTYILYVSYVGVFHFGLLDGIVLRYSQYDYDELDKPRIRSQFRLLLILNTVISIITIVITSIFAMKEMRYIFCFVAIGVITKNLFTYTSYTFQITNRISKYAILVISQRLFFGIMTVMLLLFHVQNYYLYCISDLCGDLFGCFIGYFYNKELYFGKTISWKEALSEFKINISSGIMLLIANWSSMLLIGSAKMIIQWHWDELTFGKVSFSFSISNLFLTFVSAISVVLFPSLKRMEKSRLPELYMEIRNAISPILFAAMLFYYPGCLILNMWLPKYQESLVYLGILLPIIIYTSKVSLLTNNYLKAYRAEKKMLWINTISVIIAIVLFLFSAYILNNLTVMIIMIVVSIMFRSIVSEIVVMKLIHVKMIRDFIIEFLMTIVFIFSAKFVDFWIGFGIYFVTVLVYLWLYRNSLNSYIRRLRKRS